MFLTILFIFMLLINLGTTLLMFPSSINRYPIEEFKNIVQIWGDYDSVQYQDIFSNGNSFSNNNYAKKNVALKKFRHNLPEKAVFIEYYKKGSKTPKFSFFYRKEKWHIFILK